MGNTIVNLILCTVVSIVIIALAVLAISEPISRMRAYIKGAKR